MNQTHTSMTLGFVFLCLSVCSHAKCTQCNGWKSIHDESWTGQDIRNNRSRNTPLRCKVCTIRAKRQGTTTRDGGLRTCEACKEKKGRKFFSKGLLDEKARIASCILICLECAAREKDIIARMHKINAITCHCKCVTFRHTAECGWPNRGPQVTNEELAFVSFRPRTQKKYSL